MVDLVAHDSRLKAGSEEGIAGLLEHGPFIMVVEVVELNWALGPAWSRIWSEVPGSVSLRLGSRPVPQSRTSRERQRWLLEASQTAK